MTKYAATLVDARHAGGFRVWLRFSDGLSGEIDLGEELWGPVFEPLRSEAEFAKLRVAPDLATIVWPNGADFSPDWLHHRLTEASLVLSGQPCPASGVWASIDDPSRTVTISRGDVMPPLNGRSTCWRRHNARAAA